ncbi:MAG: DUF1967 domain-containing protein [Candidatus Peribacteria bacterium]|nr:DUF1967 domain-containing protein [Candidatus Peribacteria bacterium]
MLTDVTETEKSFLIEHQYLDKVGATYLHVFLVQHPEISKLVFITPRGNEEAELRFWKQLSQKGYLDIFETAGIRKGDVLKIKSYYRGYEDKYIVY